MTAIPIRFKEFLPKRYFRADSMHTISIPSMARILENSSSSIVIHKVDPSISNTPPVDIICQDLIFIYADIFLIPSKHGIWLFFIFFSLNGT